MIRPDGMRYTLKTHDGSGRRLQGGAGCTVDITPTTQQNAQSYCDMEVNKNTCTCDPSKCSTGDRHTYFGASNPMGGSGFGMNSGMNGGADGMNSGMHGSNSGMSGM